jgi:hypothetical protein
MFAVHVSQEYAKNPAHNWKSKDAAIFLVTSLAAKAQTQKVGRIVFQPSKTVSAQLLHDHISLSRRCLHSCYEALLCSYTLLC